MLASIVNELAPEMAGNQLAKIERISSRYPTNDSNGAYLRLFKGDRMLVSRPRRIQSPVLRIRMTSGARLPTVIRSCLPGI